MNNIEDKRQLNFLRTFDKKFNAFNSEITALKAAADADRKHFGKWPVQGLQKICKTLVGAGAVYGLSQFTDWARAFLLRLEQISETDTAPSQADFVWIKEQTSILQDLYIDAMTIASGASVDAVKSSIPPPALGGDPSVEEKMLAQISPKKKEGTAPGTASNADTRDTRDSISIGMGIFICVKDSNISKQISFILKDSDYDPFEVDAPSGVMDAIHNLSPELIIVDLDDKAPWGTAILSQLRVDPLCASTPVLKVGGARSDGRVDTLSKPINSQEMLKKCANLIEMPSRGTGAQLQLKNPNLDELYSYVTNELQRGILDAEKEHNVHTRFKLRNEGDIVASTWALIAALRQNVVAGSGGHISFAPVTSGRTSMTVLSEGNSTEANSSVAHLDKHSVQSLENLKVVIAHTDETARTVLTRILKRHGMSVRASDSGTGAYALISAGAPDFVISALSMGDQDGWELENRLRADYRLKDIPVVILSWDDAYLGSLRHRKNRYAPVDEYRILDIITRTLQPRLSLNQKLSDKFNFSGRVEQHGTLTILKSAAKLRRNCRIHFLESWNDYSVHIENGDLKSLTMTGTDGSYASGRRALNKLIGIENGRFEVKAPRETGRSQFKEPFVDVINASCNSLNRLARMILDSAFLEIRSVALNDIELERYETIVPSKMRPALERIKDGISPRAIVEQYQESQESLELLLLEMVRLGVILEIEAPEPSATEPAIARNTQEWQQLTPEQISDAMVEPELELTTSQVEILDITDIEESPTPQMPQAQGKWLKWVVAVLFAMLSISIYFHLQPLPGNWAQGDSTPTTSSPNTGDAPSVNVASATVDTPAAGTTTPPKKSAPIKTDTAKTSKPRPPEEANNSPTEPTEKQIANGPTNKLAKQRPKGNSVSREKSKRNRASASANTKPADAPSKGKLRVTVAPGAPGKVVVYIDGKRRGAAPTLLQLKPGLREISFKSGAHSTLRIVSIKAGQTKSIEAKF